ncbi:Ig-like domain-containing protein [Colwellia sp. UCD-KL20]|uniref:Ig-like domain-containing protein n=1 Tax=Colwellia sp. UCD-KL20 TaxID=1917165 RepID=UPI0009713557|nr:Ig-like domain-containing protein [Colwellia sp. UCD-KL20]
MLHFSLSPISIVVGSVLGLTQTAGFAQSVQVPVQSEFKLTPLIVPSINSFKAKADDLVLATASSVKHLVIIDAGVPDKTLFYRDLYAETDIIELHADESGIKQIEELLGGYQQLESVSIFSHGRSGELQLGNSQINTRVIENNPQFMAVFKGALKSGGDVFFYGCDIGKGSQGDQFLTLFSQSTDLDVAASNDLTGNRNKGGDWDLEIVKGDVDFADRPFSERALIDFSEVLAFDGTLNFDNIPTGYANNKSYVIPGTSYSLKVKSGAGGGQDLFNYSAGYVYISTDTSTQTYSKIYFTNNETFDLSSLYVYNSSGNNRVIRLTTDKGGVADSLTLPSSIGENVNASGTLFTGIKWLKIAYSDNTPLNWLKIDNLSINNLSGNSAPVVDLNGVVAGTNNTVAFTEGSGALNIAPSATVTDSDGDTITTITVALTNDQDGGFEGLNVSASAQNALGGISGASDISLQDTISIIGATATTAEVVTFLKAITYNNTSTTPTETARTVSVVINDGTENSISRTATISVANLTAASSTVAGFSTLDGTNLNPAITFSSDNETLTISNPSHITGSVADGGTGTDTIHVPTGSNLTAFTTLTSFETLTMPSSATLTLTEAQHEQFTTISGSGAPVFTITAGSGGDANLTANSTIATYVLNTPVSLTLVDRDQSVTGSNLADSVDISNFSYRGTLDGGDGTDTLTLADGASLAAATISNFETLNLSGGVSVTMKEAQHDAFSTISGAGTDQITILDATNGLIAANDIETYVLSTANTITLSNGSQNITASTGADTVNIAGLTVTGTLNANGGNDTLSMATGADTTSATVSSFENLSLATNSSVALSAAQVSTFIGSITASGAETITVSGDGNFTTLSNIETFNVGDDSRNIRTILIGSAFQNITANSETDAITFAVGSLTLTGALTGKGTVNDTLSLSTGANITAATISDIENLTLASGSTVSMTRAQHASFTGSISALGAQTVNITGDGDFSTLSDIETYSVGDDSSNNRTIAVVSASQNITDNSSNTSLTFALGGASFTGSLTSEPSVADMVSVTDGADVTSGTFFNLGTLSLASAATVAIDVNNLSDFSTAITGSAGSDTLKLMDGGTFNFTGTTVSGIESLALGTNNNTTITLTDNFNAGVVSFSNASGSAITAAVTLDASAFSADILTMTSSNFNGDDILKGGSGADTLRPGAGTDTLTGNAGNDNFVGNSSQLSGDTITDLASGDRITITGITGLSASNVRFNGTSALEVDTNATDFNISELTLSLTNAPGNDLAFTVADSGSDTVITFMPANSAPTFSSLNGGATYIENGIAAILDSDMTIADEELDALNGNIGDYNNARLTINRNGGASTQDVFGNYGLLGVLTEGNTFSYNGISVGTVTTNSAGTLKLTFNSNANSAIVDSIAQSITYLNNSDDTLSSAVFNYTFNDGVLDSVGTNQATVILTKVNDAPTVTAIGANPTFTENGSPVGIFSSASISTIESGQNIEQILLTVSNVTDIGYEFLQFGSDLINLEHNASGTYSGAVNFSYLVTLSGSTATVTVTASDSAAVWQNYVPFLQYKNTSHSPTEGSRLISLTSIKDSAGILNGGVDISTGSFGSSSVSVVGVNVAPVISGSASIVAAEDVAYSFTPIVTDADSGDTKTFSITNKPSWAVFNTATGALTGTPNNIHIGLTSNIVITVTDTAGATDSLAGFNLTVTNTNDAPIITGTPVVTIAGDTAYSFTPSVTDDDSGDTKTFSITNKPSWAVFDTATGTLTGTPSRTDANDYTGIIISVADSSGASASLPAFTLTVTNTNDAPIAKDQTHEMVEDSELTVTLVASDSDDDTLTYSIVSEPLHGSLMQSVDNSWVYTADENYNGIDSFTYKATDPDTDSEPATIDITITPVNDKPIAQDDQIALTYSENGRYVLDVLSNDSDVDDDQLTIINASSSIGTTSIENGQLIYNMKGVVEGNIELQYAINDGHTSDDNGNNEANVTISFNGVVDALLPVITLPDDIETNATALFTKVDLGFATALDSQGKKIPVSLVDNFTQFAPGNNLVYWQAIDNSGFSRIATQHVVIHPLVNLAKDQQGTEGGHFKIPVRLNGKSPNYPVTVPYSVGGNADSNDHNLVAGELVINSGLVGYIEFDTFTDEIVEANETLTITLGNTVNLGAKPVFTLTITENNIAPHATLSVSQNNELRTIIDKSSGDVVISSEVSDENIDDTHTYSWVSASGELVDIDADETRFTFDPTNLMIGQQTLSLTVMDDNDIPLSTEVFVYIDVVQALPILTSIDSDGDLIPDNIEGLSDSDGDGIADYLDNSSTCNVQPEELNQQRLYLTETEPGTCLRRGVYTTNNASGSILLNTDEVAKDEEATNIGGLFDFIVTNIPAVGQSISLVLPQRLPVPENAVYRKLTPDNGWSEFVVDDKNYYSSAPGEVGYCPAPNDSKWVAGLTAGHWCVQVTIEDGGLNDDDGVANNQIVDPGGVAVVRTLNQLPEANYDDITIAAGELTTIDVLKNDTDVDGDTLTLSGATVDFGDVSIVDGQLLYIPPAGFIGVATIEYSISDGQGGTSNSQVSVNLVINNAPTAVFDSAATTDNTSIEIDVLHNDSDIDGDEIFIVAAVAVQGTVSININGTLQYTPKSGFDGVDIIDYTVRDSKGVKSTAQVEVTVSVIKPVTINNKSSGGSMGGLGLLLISALVISRRRSMFPSFTIITTSCLISTSTMADTWSFEGTLGESKAKHSLAAQDSKTNLVTIDNTDTSWSIGAYYNLSSNWELALRYIDLGEGQSNLKANTVKK